MKSTIEIEMDNAIYDDFEYGGTNEVSRILKEGVRLRWNLLCRKGSLPLIDINGNVVGKATITDYKEA